MDKVSPELVDSVAHLITALSGVPWLIPYIFWSFIAVLVYFLIVKILSFFKENAEAKAINQCKDAINSFNSALGRMEGALKTISDFVK